MKIAYLTLMVTITIGCPKLTHAQARPLSVCEALNASTDHQTVLIHAAVAATRHETYLFDGNGQDPCPGWRKRFFTAPAAIPLVTVSYAGVQVPTRLFQDYLDLEQRLKSLQSANPFARNMVTIKGVVIRKPWTLIFRQADGAYVGLGAGLNGTSAALLVVTSAAVVDR